MFAENGGHAPVASWRFPWQSPAPVITMSDPSSPGPLLFSGAIDPLFLLQTPSPKTHKISCHRDPPDVGTERSFCGLGHSLSATCQGELVRLVPVLVSSRRGRSTSSSQAPHWPLTINDWTFLLVVICAHLRPHSVGCCNRPLLPQLESELIPKRSAMFRLCFLFALPRIGGRWLCPKIPRLGGPDLGLLAGGKFPPKSQSFHGSRSRWATWRCRSSSASGVAASAVAAGAAGAAGGSSSQTLQRAQRAQLLIRLSVSRGRSTSSARSRLLPRPLQRDDPLWPALFPTCCSATFTFARRVPSSERRVPSVTSSFPVRPALSSHPPSRGPVTARVTA